MHETVTKRLFIGGLASDVSSEEIYERFSRFGKVSNLSLKTRTDQLGKSFAHLDLEGDESNIKKCFSTYQNAKWKGTVLQLQYAKESFLKKLEKEIKETQSQKEVVPEVKATVNIQKLHSELLELKGQGVPGTPVPGKKDWVVGKYGRVLPVLKLKKSYKIKMEKIDPSKHCHAATIFKDDKNKSQPETSCAKLTWEMNVPDTDITKKRKGEFPERLQSTKKIKSNFLSPSDFYKKNDMMFPKKVIEEVEIVKAGLGNSNLTPKLNRSNRFDSDAESGSEDDISFGHVFADLQMKKRMSDISQPGNKISNIKVVSKPANTTGELTGAKPTNRNTYVEPVLSTINRTSEIIKSKVTNKKGNVKTKSSCENKTCEIAGSKPAIKNNETKAASTILIVKDNQNSLPTKKTSAVAKSEITCLDSHTKIPEFKGLGMMGLLPQNDSVSKTESEFVIETHLNSTTENKPSLAMEAATTKESGKRSQPHGVGSISPTGKQNAVSELFGASVHSALSDVRKRSNEATLAINSKCMSSNLKDKQIQLAQKSSDHFREKLTIVKNKQPLSSTLLNFSSNSVLKESDKKSYDSSSSADTDEIIAQCKKRKGLTLSAKEVKELPPGSVSKFKKAETNSRQMNTESGKNIKLSRVEHNLGLSEYAAGISDYLEQPASRDRLASQNDNSDLYDSDLDSNDFALVARKLAQKTVASKTRGSKALSVIVEGKNTLGQSQDLSKTHLQKNRGTKTQLTAGGQVTADVVPAKSKTAVSSNSSVNNSNCVSKQAADNEKRLQAIRENMKLKELQQSMSRDAFKNVDSKDGSVGTRVVFSSSDDSSDDDDEKTTTRSEKTKLELFDSSGEEEEEEDYSEIFKSKPHFEGQKGEKLMRLELKIGDPRFKLDAKFAVSDSEDEDEEQPKKSLIAPEVNQSLEEEKTANLRVLENVIGKTTLDRFSEKLKRNTKHIVDMNAVRFDPTKIQKTELCVIDKKLLQAKKTINTVSNTDKKLDPVTKKKEEQAKPKTDDKNRTKDKKADKIKKKIEIDLDKEENIVSDTKKQRKVKLKSDKELRKAENAVTSKAASASSTNIQLSSSLLDLFKKKNGNNLSNEDTESFSLLQQFDKADDDSDEDFPYQSQAPLSALLKKGTEMACDNKAIPTKSISIQSEEKSTSETESTSDETTDEEGIETVERGKQVESADPVDKRVSFSVDEDSDESMDEDDGPHLQDGDKADDKIELISAGRVNVRYSKEQWLQRWEDLRPALVKLYKRKHKDALRNKRKNNEMKRKKDFLKNSKRNHWVRKRVS